MRKRRKFLSDSDGDTDPLSGMANLFDVAMVFAVALMVAAVTSLQVSELLTESDATIVKNPGKPDMEIIVKKDNVIERYKGAGGTGDGKGRRIGAAYELENGQIIYVPEGDEAGSAEPVTP
jgi:hypothetical protein